jgi:hypothetical protein
MREATARRLHHPGHPQENLALIYAGLTRLKRSANGSWLTVVCSAPELEAFGRSWPSYNDHRKLARIEGISQPSI